MKSRLCSHCTLISLVFFNLIVGLHCHFAIYLFPSLCSDRDVTLKGVIWCDFTPWSVTSCSCIDKIPKVAMASLKPKEIFFKKVKTRPHPPKRLIQTRPHMSTSRCGNSCVMHPNVHLKKEAVVSLTAVVLMQPCQGDAVCFYMKAKALYLAFRKYMQLGIIG